MFDLRSARYFVAVAEELHFGRAAQRLQMSQPPLSQAIRQLERDVGVPLFERTNRRVSLTTAGEAFLPECRDLLRRANAAAETPRLAAHGIRARITVGAVASALTWPLPEALRRLRERAPHLAVHVHEVDTDEVETALRDGRIDIALARLSGDKPGLHTTTIVQDEFVVLLPEGHPSASAAGPIDLSDLVDDPWIWIERQVSPDYYDDMTTACRESRLSPRSVHWVRSITSQISLVQCGVGVTIVPRTATSELPAGVVPRTFPNPAQTVALAVSVRERPQPAEQLLRDLVLLI